MDEWIAPPEKQFPELISSGNLSGPNELYLKVRK
jgi:hypothetical protein